MADLFLWQINDSRSLALSVRRNSPGYADALASHSVGDIVSGTIADVSSGGILVNVNGVIGWIFADELPLADGQASSDLYSAGEHMADLFLWQINDNRSLALSVRRNSPGYADALASHSVGDIVSGTIADVSSGGILVNVNGVIGWIFASELFLADGQVPSDLYSVGEHMTDLFLWQIDRESRDYIISSRPRHGEDGPHIQGQQIKAIFRGPKPGGINVLVASRNVFIPDHELDCFVERQLRFEPNSEIDVVVLDIGEDGLANRLSHRRAMGDWKDYVAQLADGVLVPNVVVIPEAAMSNDEQRVAVDLGPITGYIQEKEFNPSDAAEFMSFNANKPLGVVIKSVDPDGDSAIVSLENFDARWQELADGISENNECDGILRQIAGSIAVFDLGSGLLGEMAWEPRLGAPAIVSFEDIGKTLPVRITRIDRISHSIGLEHRDKWLEALIGESESQTLEFKEVLKGGKATDDESKMKREAIRTVVGFLNTDGGRLIIGIKDSNRDIVGLEADQGLAGDTIDKKIDSANQILHKNLQNIHPGNPLEDFDIVTLVVWETVTIRGKTLLIVSCDRGPESGASWIVKGKSEFYARKGDSTEQLRTREEIRDHLVKRNRRATGEDEQP